MYTGRIIDCDVHHTWKKRADLFAYLPAEWRAFAETSGPHLSLIPATGTYPNRYGRHNKRVETFAADGSVPGSDLATLQAQLLDRHHIERAVLLFDVASEAGHPNAYFATALTKAMNDWNADRWLNADKRLFGAIATPTQFPDEAAREIRRVGKNARMVTVLINWIAGLPYGHPFYHPIYEAAAELDLPVSIHVGYNGSVQRFAGGIPSSKVEMQALLFQGSQHHFTSLVTHGVFERFPRLKLILVEAGIAWVPWLIWNLDANYELLAHESPWVKKLPSEYFREHVRLTTQPIEVSPKAEQLVGLLEAFGGFEDLLCFSTDYPHWDSDDPTFVSRRLPEAWHDKLFYRNALATYRWPG